ncbi:MAG TPA: hypothetical protein VLL97_06930 [Acidobacteriota bacterium]|nr:hypothetical protein [Acidobacteriota bacterium]
MLKIRFDYEIPIALLNDLEAVNAEVKDPILPVAIGDPSLNAGNNLVFPFIEVAIDLSKPTAIERATSFLDIIAKFSRPG